MPFENYSQYYDCLYADKDYGAETDYINAHIRKFVPQARTLLDLGCGTGGHALRFCDLGYRVAGVDMSMKQLEIAQAQTTGNKNDKPDFIHGDVRSVRIEKKFDAVLSLFHVINYQSTNDDLIRTFKTVRAHLKEGGVFIFDTWYGPAVLNLRPETRIKRVTHEHTLLTRLAEPVLHPNKNQVEVNYEIIAQDTKTGQADRFKEMHLMRYLFLPEIEHMLSLNGMKLEICQEWMSDRPLGEHTWSGCIVATVA